MKLFAFRALDYLHAGTADDRRYVLFASVQKATVSSEAVRVIALLSECIGAKGFESDTYFETALRDVPLVPILEGSTHINHQSVAQFARAYFARRGVAAGPPPASPPSLAALGDAAGESPYLMAFLPGDEHLIRFAPFLDAYRPLRRVRNVLIFVRQAAAFRRFALSADARALARDVEVAIALGKCLSIVAYAQLVAEHCTIAGVAAEFLSVLFHQSIEALTAESLRLSSTPQIGPAARAMLRRVTAVPQTAGSDFEFVHGRM
jgi:acyl-CoA dehydrogenase